MTHRRVTNLTCDMSQDRRLLGQHGAVLDRHVTCERTDGNIHTDHASKIITVLVYFNEEWGSEGVGGCLRMLRSSADIEDYTAEVKPLGGTLLAFRRTDHSWHGHKQFVGERRMLQYNFLSNAMLARISQKVSRASTHFGKRVLGLR